MVEDQQQPTVTFSCAFSCKRLEIGAAGGCMYPIRRLVTLPLRLLVSLLTRTTR